MLTWRCAGRAASLSLLATFLGCPADKRDDGEHETAPSQPPATVPLIESAAPLASPRIDLPGMSIEAPGYPAIRGDYAAGSAQTLLPLEWVVTWQRGALPPADALQSITNAMLGVVQTKTSSHGRIAGTRDVEVGGKTGREYEITTEVGYTLIVTFAECGGRTVQILTGGMVDARTNSDKLVKSFRCTPDPKQDVDRVAVAVDARPGWKRTKPSGPPMLVNDRGTVVNATSFPSPDPSIPLEAIVPTAVRSAGFIVDAARPKERDGRKVWRATVDVGGKSHPAAIVAWRCDAGRLGAVYVFAEPGASVDDGLDLAMTARCLGPDEVPPTYPLKGD